MEINEKFVGIKKLKRPMTGRPTTGKISKRMNNMPANNNISNNSDKTEKISEEESNKDDVSVSIGDKEKLYSLKNNKDGGNKFSDNHYDLSNLDLNSVDGISEQKMELEKMIKEENDRIEFITKQKTKLKNVDLIEKNIDGLYDWKSLFSKSRPLTAYTNKDIDRITIAYKTYDESVNYTHEKNSLHSPISMNEYGSGTNRSSNINTHDNDVMVTKEKPKYKTAKPFQFPIALIDEGVDKLKDFITIPKNISLKRKKMEEASTFSKTGLNFKKSSTTLDLNINVNINKITDKNFSSTNTNNIKNSSSASFKNLVPSNNMSQIHNNSQSLSKTFRKDKEKDGKRGNAARPQSVFAARADNDVVYLNKAFSDYFTQDFKDFTEKFPLLHPKVRCNNSKLKKTISQARNGIDLFEEEVLKEKQLHADDLIIAPYLLTLAAKSKNVIPLLKSIYKQTNPEIKKEAEVKTRLYLNSNKPLGGGENITEIDFKKNVRNKNMKTFYSEHDQKIVGNNNNKNNINNDEIIECMNIEMYNEDDPDIIIMKTTEIQNTIGDKYEFVQRVTTKTENNSKEILNELEDIVNPVETNKPLRPYTAMPKKHPLSLRKTSSKGRVLTARPKISSNILDEYDEKYNSNKNIKTHRVNIHSQNSGSQTPMAPPEFISTKSLPVKDKPKLKSNAYKQMQNKMTKNHNTVKNMFEDAMQIQNVNYDFHNDCLFDNNENSYNDNLLLLTDRKPSARRPYSKIDRIASNIFYLFYFLDAMSLDTFRPTTSKNRQLLNENKLYNKAHSKINNVYFNDYIDMQFRVLNPTLRNEKNNLEGSENAPPIWKNSNKLGSISKQNNVLSNLMVVENFSKQSQRNAQSAKQKFNKCV